MICESIGRWTVESNVPITRSRYGWLKKSKVLWSRESGWAWLVHRRITEDQLALFWGKKPREIPQCWILLKRDNESRRRRWRKIVDRKKKGRWKEEKPTSNAASYLLPFLTLQLLLKPQHTHTHTHTLPHTHTYHTHIHLHVRTNFEGKKKMEGSAGREDIVRASGK